MDGTMKRRNRVTDWLAYAALRLFCLVVYMFPIEMNLRTARLLGWIWYRFLPRHRNRAIEHLRLAYGPALSSRAREQIALRCMQQMAMMAMETLFTPRLITPWTSMVRPVPTAGPGS